MKDDASDVNDHPESALNSSFLTSKYLDAPAMSPATGAG